MTATSFALRRSGASTKQGGATPKTMPPEIRAATQYEMLLSSPRMLLRRRSTPGSGSLQPCAATPSRTEDRVPARQIPAAGGAAPATQMTKKRSTSSC